MDEVNYSHSFVTWLVTCLPHIDEARRNDPLKWKLFTQAVSVETGNVYLQEWSTSDAVIKMADDIGSYLLLIDIWSAVDEIFDPAVFEVTS